MKKITKLLWNEMIYAQVLQEWHANKEWSLTYNYKIDDKIYLNEQNIKMQQFSKKLNWKFLRWYLIKKVVSFYVYELDLSEDMKMHSMFHVSLLLLLKHDLMRWQVSELLLVTVESEEDLYFVNLIDDMRWWIQEAWFELLIKWKEYEWRTWESYTTIKKDALTMKKEFHEDHVSWSVSMKWTKNENRWLLSDKWTSNFMRVKKNMKLTEIVTLTLIKIQIWSLTWNTISITHIWRN